MFHHIDTVFNDQLSQHAAGQVIAIYEAPQTLEEPFENCAIYEDHIAFSYNQITYATTPDSCLAAHITAVASVVSGMTESAVCGSSIAEIFVPNHADYTYFYPDPPNAKLVLTSTCLETMTVENYEEINAFEAMAAINESFGCMHEYIGCSYSWASERDGVTQDYYARYYDHVVVKAAGNQNCNNNMEACPWTLNSVCVGGVDSNLDMYYKSSYANPGHLSSFPATDREEPDVVAYAGQTFEGDEAPCLASLEDPEGWFGTTGTSFAAPIVTSLVALFRAECEPVYEARFGAEYVRARLRTAAWGGNADGTAYSTPRQPETDWKDGAGVIFAEGMVPCPEPEDTTVIVINLGGGDPMPEGDPIYIEPGNGAFHSPNETQNHQPPPGAQPADYTDPPGTGRKQVRLGSCNLGAGDRIRATVSWSGCADEPTGEGRGQVAVDYDLFLFRPSTTNPTYVWASQSEYDNNEGFDYTVATGEGGTYDVLLSWPESSQSCEETQYEPVGVSVRILSP